MAGKRNYELEIIISGNTDQSLGASVQNAIKKIMDLERQARQAEASINDTFGGWSTKGIDTLAGVSDKAFASMIKGGKIAAATVGGGLTASVGVGMGFEAQMSTVSAIAQASEADMVKLNAIAKEMGETTQFSAQEAGQGLEYMAMAGWKTQDMVNGLPGVMYLAAASGEELGTVSDIVTDAMTAFGMPANEAMHFADVLAQASAKSNTNVAMMGETFQYVAPVAGAFNYSIEDVAIATGLMANAGIKAEKAGTAMRTMLTNLAKPTKQMQGYMDKLSISLVDDTGQMKPFRQQLVELRDGFAGLSEAQKAEYAAGIAGKEGMSGLLAIVTASQKDFDKLATEIDRSAGAAKKMAEVRIDNLAGDLTLLKSAAEGAGIEIYEGMSSGLRGLTQIGTKWIGNFTENIKEDMPTIQRQIKTFGQDIADGFGPIMEFGTWCKDHPEIIQGTITGIVGALASFKAVQGMKDGVAMLKSLSAMASAWPVAAIGLVVGSIAAISKTIIEHNKKLKKEDMAKRFGNIKLSLEELDETARLILDNGNFDNISLAMEEMGKVGDLEKEFEAANKTLNRLNWKMGIGIALDETDQQLYQDAIAQMAQESIAIIEQSQYTATISVQALFGTNSEKGNELIGIFNNLYAEISAEVAAKGKELGDAYSEALEDGIIDIEEAPIIQQLQQELDYITKEVLKAQNEAKLDRLSGQAAATDLDPETFKNLQEEKQSVLAEQEAALAQATDSTLTNLELAYNRKKLTEGEYQDQKEATLDQYNQQIIGNRTRSLEWSLDAIEGAYGDTLQKAMMGIENGENLDKVMRNLELYSKNAGNEGEVKLKATQTANAEAILSDLGLREISQAERDGIADLWKTGTKDDYLKLKEAIQNDLEAGKEISSELVSQLADAAIVGTVAGDEEAIWQLMSIYAGDNPEYAASLQKARDEGYSIPQAIGQGIKDNSVVIDTEITSLYGHAQEMLDTHFANMKVKGNLTVDFSSTIITKGISGAREAIEKVKNPDHYADGGLITNPTLSWFAEDSPEMAIPIDGSDRSMNLWRETGRLLGAYEDMNYSKMNHDLTSNVADSKADTGAPFTATLNLTINLSGEKNLEDEIGRGAEAAFEKFKEFMAQYQHETARLSIG